MTASAAGKRFGVIDDDQRRAMSGLEFVQGLVDGTLPLNTMAQTLGYDIVEVTKGRVVAAAGPHAGHCNPAGTVHGGLAATLLDTCMGIAVQSAGPAYHPADRPGEGGRQGDFVRAPGRDGGRNVNRPSRSHSRARHDHVLDLRALNIRRRDLWQIGH